MESELERILKSEKKLQATAPPGVLLFLGVAMCLLGLVPIWLRIAGFSTPCGDIFLIFAAFSFIAYYRAKQSRVNVEFAKAIKEIRERLNRGESL